MTSEQEQKLLKAKVAAALHRETGKVPSREQVEEVTLLARVLYKAVLGVQINRPEQKSLGPVPSPTMQTGYARVSPMEQTMVLQLDALTQAAARGRIDPISRHSL